MTFYSSPSELSALNFRSQISQLRQIFGRNQAIRRPSGGMAACGEVRMAAFGEARLRGWKRACSAAAILATLLGPLVAQAETLPPVDSEHASPGDREPDSIDAKLQESLKEESPKTLEERLDKIGLLYENDDNPILQQLWFLGRYHGQYHASDGEVGGASDWENRRFRIGTQGKLLEKLTFHAQMISGNDMEDFYNGFSELWVSWEFDDALVLSVGQQKHRFTHERNVSSRYINTLERSMLVNMFNCDYTPAITLSGKTDDWMYYTGFFSNATSSNIGEAMTELDSGYSYLLSATRDYTDEFQFDSMHWTTSFLHSDANENATNLNQFQNGLSTALIFTEDRSYVIGEAIAGIQSDRGNAFGVNIQPGTFLTERLQLTTRYQIAISDDEFGLIPQRRYERPAGMSRGDLYQAAYAGLNYFIAGHRIKAMNGLEYSNMNGDGLWTASIMFRTYWGPHSSGPFPMAQTL